jgi:hypothetical protein
MNKYNIEGGIDFFAELYKSLDIEDSKENIEDDKSYCLITNKPLIDKYVSLNCGHKFNYIPIYNDIFNHKKKFNYMECTSRRLNMNEIRCPYCRRKQQGVLPYYQELGLKKVNGVNFYDPDYKQYYMYSKCEYVYPNENYDTNQPESDENLPYLINTKCHLYGFPIAVYNSQNPYQPINYGDSKHYCYIHNKLMIKQYKYLEKEKVKLAKKQAKELEKQMKILEKQKTKVKEKEDKLKASLAKILNKPITENVVLSPSVIKGPTNIENQTGCIQILKTGLNKGKPCGCKVFSNNVCKRHIPKNEY